MSNIISFNSDTISMSNGLTDVFISVLVLSGSRLAETVDEKRLIVWFAEKDQSRVGMGTVGFDIREMPWNIERFEESRLFMLNTVWLDTDDPVICGYPKCGKHGTLLSCFGCQLCNN